MFSFDSSHVIHQDLSQISYRLFRGNACFLSNYLMSDACLHFQTHISSEPLKMTKKLGNSVLLVLHMSENVSLKTNK